MTATYLIVPGFTNSGPDHWQTFMQRKYGNVVRVEQDDWNSPSVDWVKKLNQTVNETEGDIVLIGHSCGAVAVSQWAIFHSVDRVKALVLVAPADVDAEESLEPIRRQGPLPTKDLGYKSLLIYSDNDEHLGESRAFELASCWGCKTHLIPGGGHLHTAAGYGEWLEGERLIENFTGIPLIRTVGRE